MRKDPVLPAAPPDRADGRVGRAWTVRFGCVWLGLWAAQLAPVQLLLPTQLEDLDPVHKVRDFGLVNGLAGLAALIALPVFGALCDRTRSRSAAGGCGWRRGSRCTSSAWCSPVPPPTGARWPAAGWWPSSACTRRWPG